MPERVYNLGKCYTNVIRWCFRSPARAQAVGSSQHMRQKLSWVQARSIAASHSYISPALLSRARSVAEEHKRLSEQLGANFDTEVAKKVGELSLTATAFKEWKTAQTSIDELHQLLQDPSAGQEIRSLASDEIATASEQLSSISSQLQSSLVPIHPFAELPCLLEIRPGAGGAEAGLFASDLLRMYQAFCKRRNLRTIVVKLEHEATSGSESGSFIKEAILEVESSGAYELLRCEAGVHRVQRVPATESKGRTHTSAVAVIVMPAFPTNPADEMGQESFNDPESDYYVNPTDVQTDVMRASGAGGQHVNKTDSAVRLTHLPSGTVVAMQDSRSQHQNRAKAWQILRARIAQARREAREEEQARLRLNIVGIAKMGRGDKIRTYNWSQQRVTDHRSGITLHHLDDILQAGDSLDKVMDSVKAWLRERDIEALLADHEAAMSKS